jgi:hypothetical protein
MTREPDRSGIGEARGVPSLTPIVTNSARLNGLSAPRQFSWNTSLTARARLNHSGQSRVRAIGGFETVRSQVQILSLRLTRVIIIAG